jgi:hypothetical protein
VAKKGNGGKKEPGRYAKAILAIFRTGYKKGKMEIPFTREELLEVSEGKVKNIGDLLYSFRYRSKFPEEITSTVKEPEGWIIAPRGIAKYALVLHPTGGRITPDTQRQVILIPDATPEIIAANARNDEQALLAKVRYNRLIDIFTGITGESLQSHYRTQIEEIGQIEVDEMYVGIDKNGRQYFMPLEAKGKTGDLSVIQIGQNIACGKVQFPHLILTPLGAKFLQDDSIAMFKFNVTDRWDELKKVDEQRYKLVPANEIPAAQIKPPGQ